MGLNLKYRNLNYNTIQLVLLVPSFQSSEVLNSWKIDGTEQLCQGLDQGPMVYAHCNTATTLENEA